MLSNPNQVVERLNRLAPNIGMRHVDKPKMIDNRLFLFGMFVLDITALGEWMETNYPSYKDKSLEQFLQDKDPEHLSEWKELLGVEE